MRAPRRKRKARLERMRGDVALIHFIPGGFYWLAPNGMLMTGVHHFPASAKTQARFIDQARRAVLAKGEWVL